MRKGVLITEVRPYLYEYIDAEIGDVWYGWQCANEEGDLFPTLKEASIDFMWYLYDTRKILPGEVVVL